MNDSTLSAVVVCRDEEDMLPGCLARLAFADEVVVLVDERTVDGTERVAHEAGATVRTHAFVDFANMKNTAISMAASEWVVIVDADERVTSELASDIRRAISSGGATAYRIPIENYFFGRRMRHGGWRERPIRLFRRTAAHYEGDIHERLIVAGSAHIPTLGHGIAHFSHRSIGHNLRKTMAYAELQAAEMHAAGHPAVTARTLLHVVGREVARHAVVGRAWRDGMPGVIEAIYQPFSLFTVYVRLWELQQKPSLEERYRQLDREV